MSAIQRSVQLRPPQNRIEKRAVWWWTMQSALITLPVVAGLSVATWYFSGQRWWLGIALAIAVVWALVGIVVEPRWRYAVHRWETNDQAVYALSGWHTREWRVAPMSRIQTVDSVRGPLEQILGLATLRVTTASSYGTISIAGLSAQTAEELAEQLTEITEAIPGDAT